MHLLVTEFDTAKEREVDNRADNQSEKEREGGRKLRGEGCVEMGP